jgi:hypothetical protein
VEALDLIDPTYRSVDHRSGASSDEVHQTSLLSNQENHRKGVLAIDLRTMVVGGFYELTNH